MKVVENKFKAQKEAVQHSQPEEAAQYDPRKNYSWQPNSTFVMNGEEFGIILNSLRALLNTPEAQRILLADKANKVIENSLARAVEVGVAKKTPKK